MYAENVQRKEKDVQRIKIASFVKGTGKILVAFILTTPEIKDILLFNKMGVTGKWTKWLIVERNKEIAKKIESVLFVLKMSGKLEDFYVHCGEAETFSIKKKMQELGWMPIDFAFFDFCGEVTDKKMQWLQDEAVPCCKKNAPIALTFSVQRRQDNRHLRQFSGDQLNCVHQENLNVVYKHKDISVRSLNAINDIKILTIQRCEGYQDTTTPMLSVYAKKWESSIQPSQPNEELIMSDVKSIVERFKKAGKNRHLIAGAKRMATEYVKRRVKDSGGERGRVVAALRAHLTSNGMQGAY